MITHTCIFRLKHASGSEAEAAFVAASLALHAIAGVQNLAVVRQTFARSPFDFCLTMQFDDQVAYDAYMDHPDHVAYTNDRWAHEVVDFMILDYEPMLGTPSHPTIR